MLVFVRMFSALFAIAGVQALCTCSYTLPCVRLLAALLLAGQAPVFVSFGVAFLFVSAWWYASRALRVPGHSVRRWTDVLLHSISQAGVLSGPVQPLLLRTRTKHPFTVSSLSNLMAHSSCQTARPVRAHSLTELKGVVTAVLRLHNLKSLQPTTRAAYRAQGQNAGSDNAKGALRTLCHKELPTSLKSC